MEKVYQMVTDKIIEQMNAGIIPWHKPWHLAGSAEDSAINYVTRKPYSVINQWLLGDTGEYLSFKQIQERGGRVKKGAKSKFVVFFTMAPYKVVNKDGEEELRQRPVLRYYNVFHIDNVEGIASKIDKPASQPTEVEIEGAATAAIDAYLDREAGLRFINNKPSDRAFYSPSEDKVVVPMPGQFDEVSEYFSTAFHELVHSTLIESRCNRRDKSKVTFFGSHEYSREELVAEVGAAMLCSNFGYDCKKTFRNSVAYLQSWVKNLKNDPKAIVVAAGKAAAAVTYILKGKTE